MSAGGNDTLTAAADAGAFSGLLNHTGGSSDDSLTFGHQFANSGTATLDLGVDTAADTVTFQGSIGESGGTVTIKNFNFNHDTIDVPAGVIAVTGEIADAGGNLTWTETGGNHTIVFHEIGSGGTGIVATAAQLASLSGSICFRGLAAGQRRNGSIPSISVDKTRY